MTLGQRSTPVRSYTDCLDLGLGAPVGLCPSDRLEMLGYGHHTMMRATMAPIPAAISPTETSLRFLETCPSQCRPPKRASISPRSIRAIPIRDSPIFGSMTAIGVTAAIARTAAIPCGNGTLSLCQTYKALVGNTHVLNLIDDSPAYCLTLRRAASQPLPPRKPLSIAEQSFRALRPPKSGTVNRCRSASWPACRWTHCNSLQ